MTGAIVSAGRGDAAVLRAGSQREAFFGAFAMPARTSRGSDRPLRAYAAYLAPRSRGDAAAFFLATLRRIRALPAPQLVLPGHPRNGPMRVRPAISQIGGGVATLCRPLAGEALDAASARAEVPGGGGEGGW